MLAAHPCYDERKTQPVVDRNAEHDARARSPHSRRCREPDRSPLFGIPVYLIFPTDYRPDRPNQDPTLLLKVESELASVKAKIAAITKKLEQLREQSGGGTRVLRKKPTGLLNGPADLNATKRVLGPSLTTNLNGKSKDDGEKGTLYSSFDLSC